MRLRLWLTVGMLVAVGLACALPSATPTANTQALATGVSATLTALAPGPKTPDQETPAQPLTEPTEAAPTATPTPAEPFGPPSALVVVYTDSGNAWLIDGDSAAVQLTNSGQAYKVLISSDGERVVYLQRPPNQSVPSEVRVVHSDGSNDAVLLTPQQWDGLYPLQDFEHNDVSQMAFIPGTHRLLMNTRATANGPGLFKYNDLLQLNVDSGQLTTVFAPGAGGDFTLSPDGTRVAIVQPESISLSAVDGTELHSNVIGYQAVTTYSEYQYYAQPIWRPDSSGFGVALPSADPLAPRTSGTMWSVSVPDGTATQLGQISGDFFFIQSGAGPSLSPNLRLGRVSAAGCLQQRPTQLGLGAPRRLGAGHLRPGPDQVGRMVPQRRPIRLWLGRSIPASHWGAGGSRLANGPGHRPALAERRPIPLS